ncbi:MAG: sulfite exporter TauE/SafE family protein [Gammaproteobacteria bacterium]|nr:sulfite exporter TauE/SafE family protein [Gammaproteobacteria bacterium]
MFDAFVLFCAGLLGGVVNSIAGGGSFITFPALLFAGVPPVSANATNTFASFFGYLSGAYAFRQDLAAHRAGLLHLVVVSFVGGLAGAWLLLQASDAVFREAIPWLLLFAMLLFVFGNRLNALLRRLAAGHRHASLAGASALLLLLLAVATYGGFFNAGLGIITLSYLSLAGHTDIHAMNGLKLLVSSAVSLVAIVLFVASGVLAWYEGTLVLLGTLVGGYVAAHTSRRLPQPWVRLFVIVAGAATTLYFFVDTYAVDTGLVD